MRWDTFCLLCLKRLTLSFKLCDYLEEQSKSNDGVVNMHKMMSVAALEYVGAGLGYKFDGEWSCCGARW